MPQDWGGVRLRCDPSRTLCISFPVHNARRTGTGYDRCRRLGTQGRILRSRQLAEERSFDTMSVPLDGSMSETEGTSPLFTPGGWVDRIESCIDSISLWGDHEVVRRCAEHVHAPTPTQQAASSS